MLCHAGKNTFNYMKYVFVCVCVYFVQCLHACFSHILHPVASFFISSHTLMSHFFGIGPISLSNLVNSPILLPPLGLEIMLPLSHSMDKHRMGGGAEGGLCMAGGGLSDVQYHNGALQLRVLPERRG